MWGGRQREKWMGCEIRYAVKNDERQGSRVKVRRRNVTRWEVKCEMTLSVREIG